MEQLIITAVGPDRPGIVGGLTGHIQSAGGNILDSRMVNLRGQFALVLLLECETSAAEKLRRQLPEQAKGMGLNLAVNAQAEARGPASGAGGVSGVPMKLKTYSMDQPGIVHRVTSLLNGHGVNIEELSTRQESAAFAGTPLFLMEMGVTVPPGVGMRKLREELEGLCDKLNCSLDFEPG